MSDLAIWQPQLERGLKQMGLSLSQEQQQKLLDYLELLVKWNKAYNLTAIRDKSQMVSRQLLDSLSILKLVKGKRILDVGTGAGLPGIPLAICYPEKQFTLLDSNGKKTRFVQQAKMSLGLDNLQVTHTRVDEFHPEELFDCITSRAFADLVDIANWTHHLVADDGFLLCMKGTVPHEQMKQLEEQDWKAEIEELYIPEETGQRHAVILKK